MNAWLAENNLNATTISPGGDWLAIKVPVSKANEMLDASFSVFSHDETGVQSIRTLQYSIPENLIGHLQLVHPTTTFVQFAPPLRALPVNITADGSMCSGFVTPACLQELYGIPTTKADSDDSIAVTGYNAEYPAPEDLEVGAYCAACGKQYSRDDLVELLVSVPHRHRSFDNMEPC